MTVDHREFVRTSAHYSDGWNQGAKTPRTRDEAWHFDEVRKVRDCPVGMSGVGLEAGCGDGRDTIRLTLANPAATVCSVDLSEGVFIAAQRLRDLAIPNGRVHRANLARLPFADASFDWAYSYGVLHHMPEPKDGMREIGRVLKRGAPIVMYLYSDLREYPALRLQMLLLRYLVRPVTKRLPLAALNVLCRAMGKLVYHHWTLRQQAKGNALAPYSGEGSLRQVIGGLHDRLGA